MDHVKILKRAWAILWQYRVLWIFGIVLALTTTSGSSGANGSGYTFNSDDFNNQRQWQITPPEEIRQEFEDLIRDLVNMPKWQVAEKIAGTVIAIGIGLACIVLILVVVSIIARNVAETSLIRLVDDYEKTGEKRSFREGFRMGWSKAAVRLFLINLVVAIPVILFLVVLIAVSLAPLMLWVSGNTVSGIFGTISTIGLGFLSIMFFIILAVALNVLLHFVRRASVLGDLGVVEAYKEGFRLLRENLGSIFLMWLIMLGVGIGAALIMIPIVLLSLVVSGVFSGILFLIVRGIAGLFLSGAAMWIVSGGVAVPTFILLLTVPLAFAGGLVKVYKSTVWTLAYREITVLKVIPDDSGDELAEEDTPAVEVKLLDEDATIASEDEAGEEESEEV